VLSSKSRLEVIMGDIMLDMTKLDRLASGKGNAMLVAGSIYEACRYYELFAATDLAGKCAIVTSYEPTAPASRAKRAARARPSVQLQYSIYRKMLAAWFNEPEDNAANRVEEFEKAVKKKFIEEPGQMKLLIVVDKLLTGFDAPPCTYLYIDKHMQDHGLFQAICRVNRLDGDDKEFGYVFDYKDLFKHLEGAVKDYTSEVLKGYDKADVQGLLKDRLEQARKRLEEVLESLRALCEPGGAAKDLNAQLAYFSADKGDAAKLKESGAPAPGALQADGIAGARLRRHRGRDGRGRLQRRQGRADQRRGQALRGPAQLGQAAQRRRHRSEAVRARHAAPHRHLHQGG
jgi:type I restriction enzyme R subunit